MPSKKEKHDAFMNHLVRSQIAPLTNSTNTTSIPNENKSYSNNYYNSITQTSTKSQPTLLNGSINGGDRLSLTRDHKTELDELNNRFSNYVLALRKKTQENEDLQKQVDAEKQKQKNLSNQDNHDLETQMNELRHEMDESSVLAEHFTLKHDRALKEISMLKDKIRNEEDNSYENRRKKLEDQHQQTLVQLEELKTVNEELEKLSQTNKNELNQMNDLYKKLEDELHDLVLNNIRLQCNLRSIEEKTLLKKAIYETEKTELAHEQIKQQQFYNNELDKAIEDIKLDFQTLLKNNKTILENSYKERIEQFKTQILTNEANKQQETLSTSRVPIETLNSELQQIEKVRQDLENEYRPLIDLYITKQKERNQADEERIRLDTEYNRLINEINQLTEAIEIGKQHWFSVHFELETYRKLLDLETSKSVVNNNINSHQIPLQNGKQENHRVEEPKPKVTIKKVDAQRSISKTGKFDIDQVQAGFISINNSATTCADQPLKGWSLVRTINDEPENVFQFPEAYILRAKTRVRVYSNKADSIGGNGSAQGRLIATSIPSWTSASQGDNLKIVLLDEKGVNRAQYSETWQ